MTFIKQPEKEGEEMKCPNCGMDLISRLKEYKDYPSKIQWQNKSQTKAHFDKTGNCEGTQTESTQQEITTSSNSPDGNIEPEKLDAEGLKIFDNLLLLHKIDKMTINYLGKDAQVQKIGLWTKLIFQGMSKK